MFDGVYKNHVAVDMRKIKYLAFVDMDLRGINLKLTRKVISWIKCQNSEKILKADVSMNLKKSIWVRENAYVSSCEQFKVLWFRSSKCYWPYLKRIAQEI